MKHDLSVSSYTRSVSAPLPDHHPISFGATDWGVRECARPGEKGHERPTSHHPGEQLDSQSDEDLSINSTAPRTTLPDDGSAHPLSSMGSGGGRLSSSRRDSGSTFSNPALFSSSLSHIPHDEACDATSIEMLDVELQTPSLAVHIPSYSFSAAFASSSLAARSLPAATRFSIFARPQFSPTSVVAMHEQVEGVAALSGLPVPDDEGVLFSAPSFAVAGLQDSFIVQSEKEGAEGEVQFDECFLVCFDEVDAVPCFDEVDAVPCVDEVDSVPCVDEVDAVPCVMGLQQDDDGGKAALLGSVRPSPLEPTCRTTHGDFKSR